jgi:ParB/RepB/Spo0J family partition protein
MRPISHSQTYFAQVPTSQINPNPRNPRRVFDEQTLSELASSIESHGVLQPIVVYKEQSAFVLICGERRFRAAKQAGLREVPAVVHRVPPEDPSVLSMMLIENLQRKEVDVVSESSAIRLLIEEHNWSVARVSRNLGAGSAFIRNRYLLTKYSDVLEAYTSEAVSYSQAIELATIDDEDSRRWLLSRVHSGELSDFKRLVAAVSRDKRVRQMLANKTFAKQPLDRDVVEFEVAALPYCDAACPHYFKLSWEEKKHYGIPHKKPGWAEFCAEKCGDCYAKKVSAKKVKLAKLRKLKFKRPIGDHDAGSMMWLQHKRRTCRSCPWMVEASECHEAGITLSEHVHAVCTAQSSACYKERSEVLARRSQQLNKQSSSAAKQRRKALLQAASVSASASRQARAQLTKRECVFILLQQLCFLGGQERLVDFVERRGWSQQLPKQLGSQIRYVRNKLWKDLPEGELHEVLLSEACLNAAYSDERVAPLRFRRDVQSEVPIPGIKTNG